MSLFDDIVKTVEKTETPGLESLTATEIGGISVNGDFDVDEDPMLGMAMEAMGKDVQYDADADPEAAGFSDKDIEKLAADGAAEEDEDDDYSEETIGDLLDGFVEAVYGDPEDEDPTDLLSDDDLDDIEDDLDEGMEGLKDIPQFFKNRKMKKMEKKEYEQVVKHTKVARETLLGIEGLLDQMLSRKNVKGNKDLEGFIQKKVFEIMQVRVALDEGIERTQSFEMYEKQMNTPADKEALNHTLVFSKKEIDMISAFADSKVAECEAKIKESSNVSTEASEGAGINAMEVNNKKDLRDAEKRISDLNNKIKSLKANCDSMESGISKLQKKSKKGDSNALKVIASLGDALVAQMNAQSEFNAEVAKLQANIDTYKSGVAKEKEDAKEAKRLEKEAKRLAKECAEVTADYSDNANEYKTLVEEQIDEVKEQQNNGEVTKDVATGVTNALGKFISKLIPVQKSMMTAAVASFSMTSEDVDDIAVESYSTILRVLADTDNNADSIEILTDMISDSEEYIGTLSATESVSEAKNEAFAFYTDLLDVKASLESVVATSDEEKEDEESSKDAEITAHKKNIGILTNLLEKYGKMDSDPFYKKQKSEVEALINNEKRELAKLTGEAA